MMSLLQIITPSPFLLSGQSETISVQLTSTQAFVLSESTIEIAYENTRFSVGNVQLGSLDITGDTGYDYTIFTNPLASNLGVLYAEIDSLNSEVSIAVGQIGSIETFTLTALANAPLGGNPGDINLLAKQLSSPGIHTEEACSRAFPRGTSQSGNGL